jgi:hypothetical protein
MSGYLSAKRLEGRCLKRLSPKRYQARVKDSDASRLHRNPKYQRLGSLPNRAIASSSGFFVANSSHLFMLRTCDYVFALVVTLVCLGPSLRTGSTH